MDGTYQDHWIQLLDHLRATQKLKPKHLLDTAWHGASATSLQSLWQCLTTLTVKKHFHMSSLTPSRATPCCSCTSCHIPWECPLLRDLQGRSWASLLKNGWPGCSQPLPTERAPQPSCQPCCAPLDALK